MLSENQRLSENDIIELNKQGHNLESKKTYVFKFLFNDKWNNAADPRNFRVKTSLVKKLAEDSIGMPYVVTPNGDGTRHLRATDEGMEDTTENLLKIQAKYSIGVITIPIIKPNNNVYGIIEIWPEYEDMIDQLPPFTSPTLFPLKEDADGIEDAQFLNINAVDSPGYPEIFSGVHGVCKNGIKECISELAPLGAAGLLKKARANDQIFLNNLKSLNRNMSTNPEQVSTTTDPKPEPTLTEVVTAIEGVQKTVDEVKVVEEKVVQNVENNNVVLKEVATKTEGVDENKVKEKIDESTTEGTDMPPTPEPPVGASGSQKTLTIPKDLKDHPWAKEIFNHVKETQKSLEEIKKDANARKEAEKLATRRAQATSIVEREILFQNIKEDDKEKEIKKYVDLKNEDGTYKDLEILDNYLKSRVPTVEESPIGAAGPVYPGLRSDRTDPLPTNAELMGYEA